MGVPVAYAIWRIPQILIKGIEAIAHNSDCRDFDRALQREVENILSRTACLGFINSGEVLLSFNHVFTGSFDLATPFHRPPVGDP